MTPEETVDTVVTPERRLPGQRKRPGTPHGVPHRAGPLEVRVTFGMGDEVSQRLSRSARIAEERGLPLDLVLVHAPDEPTARCLVALDLALHQVREQHPDLEVRVHEETGEDRAGTSPPGPGAVGLR